MKVISGGVAKPKGFKASGLASGIKRSGKPDLALIMSNKPAAGAAVFTKSSIKAAPLLVSQKHVKNGQLQAFVVNSGNANCFTGKFGYIYAEQTTELIASLAGIKKEDVLVLSTGIIGQPLPYKKIEKAAPKLVKSLSTTGSRKAAQAILTTDTKIKEKTVSIQLGGKTVTIAGCAKGSGMVAPNMATMLGFITTDANISSPMLKKALGTATERSFNSISVDGCMSTNDTVAIMANGEAGNPLIKEQNKDYDIFLDALTFVCRDLAKKVVLDGEGATKFIEIIVTGAQSAAQAKTIGLAVANSNLVKTAAFGEDTNWGRVAAAVGSVEIKEITENELKIKFSSFKKKHIKIYVDLSIGQSSATVYTSDLSYEYVRINVAYN